MILLDINTEETGKIGITTRILSKITIKDTTTIGQNLTQNQTLNRLIHQGHQLLLSLIDQ